MALELSHHYGNGYGHWCDLDINISQPEPLSSSSQYISIRLPYKRHQIQPQIEETYYIRTSHYYSVLSVCLFILFCIEWMIFTTQRHH